MDNSGVQTDETSSNMGAKNLMPLPMSIPMSLSPNSTSSGTASATGNPRNKTALKPGHSLMDWIRLGNSGYDLTGTRGVIRPITHTELTQHNKKDDAWMAVRGKVYNITKYMDYHPGGVEELMRGAGKDATKLFNEVHAWVNYEQLLCKCFIGPLRNTVTLNLLDKTLLPPPPARVAALNAATPTSQKNVIKNGNEINPRFDWIQKKTDISFIFYTKSLCNPGAIVERISPLVLNIKIIIDCAQIHLFKFQLEQEIQWPCRTKIFAESGKIELNFTKDRPELWKSCGQMKNEQLTDISLQNFEYHVVSNQAINHDSHALQLESKTDVIQIVPIGHHFSISANINRVEVTRSYTPVPTYFMPFECPIVNHALLVKSYETGTMSKYLTKLENFAENLQISQPMGNFSLVKIKNHSRIALLAAGSGVTPIFSILMYLMERTINRMETINILYFNKTVADIWCKEKLEDLVKKDDRLNVTHFLSDEIVEGYENGRITLEIMKNLICSKSENRATFICYCGPTIFNETCTKFLKEINFDMDYYHCFQG